MTTPQTEAPTNEWVPHARLVEYADLIFNPSLDAGLKLSRKIDQLLIELDCAKAALASAAPPEPAPASTDDLIELEGHLQKRRALHIAATVRELRKPGNIPALDASFDLACAEILHRLEHEEWAISETGWAPVVEHRRGFRVRASNHPESPEGSGEQGAPALQSSEKPA